MKPADILMAFVLSCMLGALMSLFAFAPATALAANYTLTFNANGGSVSETSRSVTYGTTVTNLPTPTRNGYRFDGWYYSLDGTKNSVVSYGRNYIYSNRTSIHVSVNMDDWTRRTAPLLECTEKAGLGMEVGEEYCSVYVWNPSTNAYAAVGTAIPPSTSATWHDFDFTLDGSWMRIYLDGELVQSKPAPTSTLTIPPSPVQYFVGADSSGTGTPYGTNFFNGKVANLIIANDTTVRTQAASKTSLTVPNQNATLYARWTPIYTVRYDANGGTGTMASTTHDCGAVTHVSPNGFSRAGYAFSHWSTSRDGNGYRCHLGRVAPSMSSVAGSTVTLYAIWVRNPVVSYHGNGGTLTGIPDTQEIPAGHDAALATELPFRRGYAFVGWNTKPDGTGKTYVPGQAVHGAVTNTPEGMGCAYDAETGVLRINKTGSYVGLQMYMNNLVDMQTYRFSADIRGVDFDMLNIGFHAWDSTRTEFLFDGSDVTSQVGPDMLYSFHGDTGWHHISATFVRPRFNEGDSTNNSSAFVMQLNRGLNDIGIWEARNVETAVGDGPAFTVLAGDIPLYAQWEPYEAGGYGDSLNPDNDHNGYGDNISFSVTSAVSFAVRPDGSLIAPTNAGIANHGDFAIHVSSVRAIPVTPYSLADPTSSPPPSEMDTIRLLLGSATAGIPTIAASDLLQKSPLPVTADWNIAPSSTLTLAFSGTASSLSTTPAAAADFAILEWYVTAGEIPAS